MNKFIYIHGYKLVLTSFACPEQYDVFDPEGEQVGYIRLRHGTLRVYYPDYGEILLLEKSGLKSDGMFEKAERYQTLCYCVELIQNAILDDMFSSVLEDSEVVPLVQMKQMNNPDKDCRGDCRFVESGGMTTLAYYPPIYDKNGVNTNPDMNRTYGTTRCIECGRVWDSVSQGCTTTFTEQK